MYKFVPDLKKKPIHLNVARKGKRNDPRILIVETNPLSDIIYITPLARELRRRYPEAEINWAIHADYASVLMYNPHIDGYIAIKGAKNKKEAALLGLEEAYILAKSLAGDYDMAIFPHVLQEARDDFEDESIPGDLLTFVANLSGFSDFSDRKPVLPYSETEERFLEKLLSLWGVEGKRLIVISHVVHHSENPWGKREYDILIGGLREIFGEEIVMLSLRGLYEPPLGVEGVIEVEGIPSFPFAAALIDRATLFIGVDSGLTAVAVSTDVPIVLIRPRDNFNWERYSLFKMGLTKLNNPTYNDTVEFLEPDPEEVLSVIVEFLKEGKELINFYKLPKIG
jgi:ADP-heptose:LPS heptosyltransferase